MVADVVEKIVTRNLGVYRADTGRLKEDVSQEAQIAEDYRGRLVYELLQNADDSMVGQASRDDRVAFLVTDDALWMANTGRSLTDDDVIGLCGLGASSKTDARGVRRASIGHKGLGFKSVLEITDRPAVFSTSYQFELGASHARHHVDRLWAELDLDPPRRVPAMRFPSPLVEVPGVWDTFREQGYRTAFCFPFRDTVDLNKRRALADQLLELQLTTVLFVKHLERIEVRVEQGGRSLEERWTLSRALHTDGAWQPVPAMDRSGLYRINVKKAAEARTFLVSHDADVPIGEHRVGLAGPAWEGVGLTEVSVAVVDPESDEFPSERGRFHVFLPTEQPCPYPFLVNGAFATDLSRQRVRAEHEMGDYNAHLVRQAARVFREHLVPALLEHSPDAVLRNLDRDPSVADATAELLHAAICDELASTPLLPTEVGEPLALPCAVMPPVTLGERGAAFRRVLPSVAVWEGRQFPADAFCRGEVGRIAADHGASSLVAAEAITVLGLLAAPERSSLFEHESGGFELDPVLDLCVDLWQTAPPSERAAVEIAARASAVFPVHRNADGSVDRVAVAGRSAFYPARSATQELPLVGLEFLCHDVCWGALLPRERTELLGDRMRAWNAMFQVRDFDFEEVMRAAVLPALTLDRDEGTDAVPDQLQDLETLAAICQLAGKRPKPDRPLRYQRLGSDRALFPLARLPLPCRSTDGNPRWAPAYSVYFGTDWLGEASVEHVLGAVPPGDPSCEHLERVEYLDSPETFLGRLELPRPEGPDDGPGTPDESDEEVDLEEDPDTPLETDERERWLAFLTWVGVNAALRPIHFHDVDDRGAGWVSTKGLTRPNGWAFAELGGTWTEYRDELQNVVAAHPDADRVDPYLYQLHDLEFLVPLLQAAERHADGSLGRRLMEHLVAHWRYYDEFVDAELALVRSGKWPSHRTRPPRALQEELTGAGDNLWMWRLRRSPFCPTTHGPRLPSQTWLDTPEALRRFGQRGRRAGDYLPLLELDETDAERLRTVARQLGIRMELSPSTFTLDDARLLTERLVTLFQGDRSDVTVSSAQMSSVVRPVYRELFELLSGRSDRMDGQTPPLGDAPLLVGEDGQHRFEPAVDVLYARGPGMKERSGVADLLPIFVLEAHPAADAPLRRLFGVRMLDEELDWHPSPGESPLDEHELQVFRDGLRQLVRPLLARIRAERSEPRDRALLEEFVARVEPVDELELVSSLDGTELRRFKDRRYFVSAPTRNEPLQAFVTWESEAWPPAADDQLALAMALADLLGLNLVEAFVAFLGNDEAGRFRLLETAGAMGYLDDLMDALDEPPTEPTTDEAVRTIDTSVEGQPQEAPASPKEQEPRPAAPRVPLVEFAELQIDGEPLTLTGISGGSSQPAGTKSQRETGSGRPAGEGPTPGERQAAPGVDVHELDALGMRIAAAYEIRRLRRAGHGPELLGWAEPVPVHARSLVVDVSTPQAIRSAEEHPTVKELLPDLERQGVSLLYPGFDLLTIVDGAVGRMIELKSSAVDARVQTMSWNEWKSARNSTIRGRFWLYLVGNLRADLLHAAPYVRAIKDPFGSLVSEEVHQRQMRRAVQLRVREFETAEHLDLTVGQVSSTNNDGGI